MRPSTWFLAAARTVFTATVFHMVRPQAFLLMAVARRSTTAPSAPLRRARSRQRSSCCDLPHSQTLLGLRSVSCGKRLATACLVDTPIGVRSNRAQSGGARCTGAALGSRRARAARGCPPVSAGSAAARRGTDRLRRRRVQQLDRARKRSIFATTSSGEVVGPGDDATEPVFRLLKQHPVCSRRTARDEWTSVHKVSDFASQREFERTEYWNEICRVEGVRYWMDFGIAPTGPKTRVFIFTRMDRDFDERDRLMLELLQPYLQKRFDNVSTRRRQPTRSRRSRRVAATLCPTSCCAPAVV